MIVADSSALISLASIDILDLFLSEFDVHTTDTVIQELEETAGYDDLHGTAAATVLSNRDRLTIHHVDNVRFSSSRIDQGEGSCGRLTNQEDAEFLITDDLRALPELQFVADAQVVISPVILKALVKRNVIEHEQAKDRLARLAESRDWLGAPIYRRALDLFEET